MKKSFWQRFWRWFISLALLASCSACSGGCAERPSFAELDEIKNIAAEAAILTGSDSGSITVDFDIDGDGKISLAEARAARRWLARGAHAAAASNAPNSDNSEWIAQWNLCAETCRQIGLDTDLAHTAAVIALQHAGKMRDKLRQQQSCIVSGNGDSTTKTNKPLVDGGTATVAGASNSENKGSSPPALPSATAATENRAEKAFSENK